MKLRNLLFGSMIACAFVACSNDDDPNPTPNPTPGDGGVAEIMVNPDLLRGNIDSKALTKAVVDESVYGNYIVYVFNRATGANLAHGVPGAKITVAENPGAVDVMVVGNVDGKLTGEEANKSNVLAATKDFTDAEEAGETVKDKNAVETTSQSSHLYPFTLQSGKTNLVGYDATAAEDDFLLTSSKIQLYRHVAKISLNKITVADKAIAEGGKEVVYANPKLNVKSVFILNAQYSTKLAAAARWGSVFNNGAVMGSVDLTTFNNWMTEAGEMETATTKPYIPVNVSKTESTYKEHSTYNSATSNIKGDISTSSPKEFTADNNFYVYESTNVANGTLLVVEADFSYDNPLSEGRIVEHGYYTVVLGKGELTTNALNQDQFPDAAISDMGVRRNIQYNVNMTVKAPGSTNPLIPNTKVASLETKIELVNYGTVTSESTFE